MEASSRRAWQVRLALVIISGVVAASAMALVLVWWKAPAASAQEPTDGASFVVRCNFSHRNMDDPIVYPGQQGAAHSHDFFGNRSTNYESTVESLRQAEDTTCRRDADKSAYWIPTTRWTDSAGTRTLRPSKGLFYYRLAGKNPDVDVQPHPIGLKVVPNSHVDWRCANGTLSNSPPTRCSNGTLLVRIKFPDCSNGRLDSADHRSHMAYAVKRTTGGPRRCPETHPIPVPQLNMNVTFSIPTTYGSVRLSSGSASTMHADFFNAWEERRLAELVDNCINAYPFSSTNPKPEGCDVTGT